MDSKKHIQTLSRWLRRVISVLLVVLIPLVVALVFFAPTLLFDASGIKVIEETPRHLSVWATVSASAVLIIMTSPLMWGFWALKKVFSSFERGELFSLSVVRHLRHFGCALIATGGFNPFGLLLLSLSLSIDLPEGQRMAVLGISSNDLVFILLGFVLVVIAHVLRESTRIAEDNAGFV